jgi:hypothetical protein
MSQQSSVGRHEIDFSWEEKVNALTNQIIIKLFKDKFHKEYKDIENIVKKHLESK